MPSKYISKFIDFATKNNFKLTLVALLLLHNILITVAWTFKIPLFYFTDSISIKFNTAFLFLLSLFILLIYDNKDKLFTILCFVITLFIFGLSAATLLEYYTTYNFNTGNFLVTDTFTEELPGRMSEATSFCFVFLSISFIGLKLLNNTTKKFVRYAIFIPLFLSIFSIILSIFQIPIEERISFFKTMSTQTSVSFLLISLLVLFNSFNLHFYQMLFGNNIGSKSLRSLTPFIVLIPILSSILLLKFIDDKVIDPHFGLITHTAVLIFLSLIYIYNISLGLNKTNRFRRKLKENIVDKNEELTQFKYALDQIAIVAITDENGVIKYANNNFCKISKYPIDEVIGNTSTIVSSGYHSESFYLGAWEKVSKGEPWFAEVKNRAKDGTFYWTDTVIVPLKKKAGKIDEYMAIKLDITKKKEAEELLNSKYVKSLQQKNKELEQFAYIASHDLQEPLRTITSFSDILREEYDDKLDEQAKMSFKFITEATSRMSSLIKSLLEYSRLGHQQKLTTINCNTILKNIITDLNTTITQTNTSIKSEELPVLKGSETGIRLLFQNLITNAIKFKKKERAPIIKISSEKKGTFWEFCVEDNGIGIAEEFQKKVFAIFQRLHLKNEYEGTGIGLAHCQKIVNSHGGEIWIESSPGKGSKFFFTILNE